MTQAKDLRVGTLSQTLPKDFVLWNPCLLIVYVVGIFSFASSFANIENCYQKCPKIAPQNPLRNIDYAYVINLEQRPERWESCLAEMDLYGIEPQRFPGIYGWDLTAEELGDIGIVAQNWMWDSRAPVLHFPIEKDGHPVWLRLGASYGKVIFYGWLTKGTIGRSLSHLSILKDADETGYRTIWVMEDEVFFCEDPHKLELAIEQLDALVGPNGWDVLYTDCDFFRIDPNFDLLRQLHHMTRPDLASFNPRVLPNLATYFTNHRDLDSNFMQIVGRGCTYSILYRASGIKKILEFYRTHHLFTDYASELAIIPNLKLFCLKENITSVHKTPSDADEHHFPYISSKIVSPWERGESWP